jgi:L-alanine-DL-glutamate epimerase-like enolase superfamily enzyme
VKLHYEVAELRTKHPFTISTGSRETHPVVWVRLYDSDGLEGWGEANPVAYYGETPETVCAALESFRRILEPSGDPFAILEIEAACEADVGGNASARAAVSAALYDLMGKQLNVPVYRLLGLDPSQAARTSFTIGIDDPEVIRQRVQEAAEYPILKIKVGTRHDEEVLTVVREEAPEKIIRVDANTAWTAKQALARIEKLSVFDLEFVEQPLPASDIEGLRFVRERSPLPIIADESCITSKDIPRLAGVVDGINIKLAKCGGLSEALRMIHTARAHNMSVMIGCMLESSLGVAAAAQLAPLSDYADLDGAALLAEDPFSGFDISHGWLHLTGEPGLGVSKR